MPFIKDTKSTEVTPPKAEEKADLEKSTKAIASGNRLESSQSSANPDSKKDVIATEKVETNFKRHDHSGYVGKIKAKAIDLVNKDPEARYARLCRDTVTDQWSLSLYRVHDKFFTFTVYVWDDIDAEFVKSLTSETRPISGWKQHLAFAADAKECTVLKGRD